MNWEALRETEKPVVLYGMGEGGERILRVLGEYGIQASGVFASDEFVRGQQFCGFRVMTYAQAKEYFGDMTVLLAFGTNRPELLERIGRIAEEQELYAPDFPVVSGAERFTQAFFEQNREKLEWLHGILADEQSVRVLENIIDYRLTGDIRPLRACETDPDESYGEILRLQPGDSIADLGAYRGDTIAEFVRWCPDYSEIFGFEPDSYTFRHLAQNTAGLHDCTLFNAAVSSFNGELPFASKGGRGSSAKAKEKLVSCVRVDDALAGRRVSFMNIDVEGQERAALEGSAETIRRYRPKLLAAAYHRSEDLFAITEQVLSLNPDYHVYLRHFPQLPGWEINLYFV